MAKERPERNELAPPQLVEDPRLRGLPPGHRRCPICHPHGGTGGVYCTRGRRRYLKCDRCGHTWFADITLVSETTHREIEHDTRPGT